METPDEKGRPKEPLILWEGWENEVLELYACGASDVEIKELIHDHRGTFSNDLWDRWMKEEAHFSETITRGRVKSQVWWERTGRESLFDVEEYNTETKVSKRSRLNDRMWQFNMKNRFSKDWKDKTETEHSGAISTTPAVIKLGETEIQVATLNRAENAG